MVATATVLGTRLLACVRPPRRGSNRFLPSREMAGGQAGRSTD
jgi:hypothetical protein